MRKPVYAICKQRRRSSACVSAWSVPLLFANTYTCWSQSFNTLASHCSWAGQFEFYLVANPEDRFFHDVAHVMSPANQGQNDHKNSGYLGQFILMIFMNELKFSSMLRSSKCTKEFALIAWFCLRFYGPVNSFVFVLFVLRLYVPVNNFSVMSGRSHRFLGN